MGAVRNPNTRAVVLAAGQGKRMKSALPKVLHEVLGRTVLARVLGAVDELGLEHIHIVIGHGGDAVRAFLEANPPATSWSTHVQEPQLGTGHALMQVPLDDFRGTLLVTVSDTPLLTAATLRSLVETHEDSQAVVSLLTTVVEDPKNYGRIVRDDLGDVVSIIEHKDASASQREIREINPAIYCFEWPRVEKGLAGLSNENQQKEYYLTDLIGWAHHNELPIASSVAADWREVAGINSRLELAEANRLLNERVVARLALEAGVTVLDPSSTWVAPEVHAGADTTILPGCYLMGDVKIGSGCLIGPHTVIHGPVSVGDRSTVTQSLVVNSQVGSDCRVGPFAHIREGARIADNVRVGNYVEIKKSEVASNTNVSHLSYVGDASLGQHVNIGAGTITANYDHITKKKSRTVIGDGASTGSNSVLVAPVEVGSGASVGAGTVVTKDVPDGALAVGRARQENRLGWLERKRSQSEKS